MPLECNDVLLFFSSAKKPSPGLTSSAPLPERTRAIPLSIGLFQESRSHGFRSSQSLRGAKRRRHVHLSLGAGPTWKAAGANSVIQCFFGRWGLGIGPRCGLGSEIPGGKEKGRQRARRSLPHSYETNIICTGCNYPITSASNRPSSKIVITVYRLLQVIGQTQQSQHMQISQLGNDLEASLADAAWASCRGVLIRTCHLA